MCLRLPLEGLNHQRPSYSKGDSVTYETLIDSIRVWVFWLQPLDRHASLCLLVLILIELSMFVIISH